MALNPLAPGPFSDHFFPAKPRFHPEKENCSHGIYSRVAMPSRWMPSSSRFPYPAGRLTLS